MKHGLCLFYVFLVLSASSSTGAHNLGPEREIAFHLAGEPNPTHLKQLRNAFVDRGVVAIVEDATSRVYVNFDSSRHSIASLRNLTASLNFGVAIEPYHVRFTGKRVKAKVGENATTILVIGIGHEDAYVARAAPLKVALSSRGGVRFASAVMKRADATYVDDAEKSRYLAFRVVAAPVGTGDHSIAATVRFWFCAPTRCDLKTESLRLTVVGEK